MAVPRSFTPDEGFLITTAALDEAYASGFRYFFVVISPTSDEKFVCMRNWVQDVPLIFKNAPSPDPQSKGYFALSAHEFRFLDTVSAKNPCDLKQLADWFTAHKDATLMLKVNEKPLIGLRHLREIFPAYATQVIPEVDSSRSGQKALELGYKRVVVQVKNYMRKGDMSPEQRKSVSYIRNFVENRRANVFAIRLPGGFMEEGRLPQWIADLQAPLYASNVLDCDDYKSLRERGIAGMFGAAGFPAPCAKTER